MVVPRGLEPLITPWDATLVPMLMTRTETTKMVVPAGFEPATSRM